jgi:hypothetical protein
VKFKVNVVVPPATTDCVDDGVTLASVKSLGLLAKAIEYVPAVTEKELLS